MELKRAVPQKSILGMYFKYIIILMLLSVGYNVVKEMKNQAELSKEVTKTNTGIFFKDVRGIDEYKQEMEEVVDFLKSPDKYKKAGAVVPKGVLLNGPPGTGKTLMAKAMASEAGVNFIYKSGSEFDEIFYGVGSQRVRELFAKARANTPCIIFIDEIDAIASKRENKVGSGMNDRLNQLLTEMDGFLPSENIIVLGATN